VSHDLAPLTAALGDRYHLERELGRGGMGAVYLARDRRLDRPVALKVLPEEFAAVPELRERFLRETRLAAGFSHPNIVPVFAVEEGAGVLAFAMGFVEGESLAARVARDGPLGQRDLVRLLQDVGYALAYAHGRGVVHRDIKPDNIMIERATGRALVMDFGIARAIAPATGTAGLTRVGEVVGTPEYMSPEQASGDHVDGRADLYSLGLVGWFAACGRPAIAGDTTQRILVRQLTEPVPSVATRRPELPRPLIEVIDRCCAKEPGERFANAEGLVEALDAGQLAAPEIPVAVRLLAPELTTAVMRALIASVLVTVGLAMVLSNGNGNALAYGVVALAMFWVGLLAALREVQRLRAQGFTVAELQRWLGNVLAERDEERARRALDTALVQRRRRRVIGAGVAASVLIGQLTWVRISSGGNMGRADALTFFASLLGIAAALTVLASSPFRRSLSERLFSLVWLGGLGRRLLALGGGRPGDTGHGNGAPPRAAVPATAGPAVAPRTVVTPAAGDGLAREVAELRGRVEALERRTPR